MLISLILQLILLNADCIKVMQDSHNTSEIQHTTHVSHDSQSDQQNNAVEAPVADSGSVSISSNDNRRVSREDIELVRLCCSLTEHSYYI